MNSTAALIQGSDAWRAARAGIATASRFCDIMSTIKSGESAARRNYRADLVVERLTGRPIDSFSSPAMKQGIEREPFARMSYEARTGAVVTEVGLFRHPVLLAGASPDGILEGAAIGIECKCPERPAHLRYLQESAEPAEYKWQIQGQMWICELEAVDFISYNPDFPENLQIVIRRIKRDNVAIDVLAGEVERFLAEVTAETERVRNLRLAA